MITIAYGGPTSPTFAGHAWGVTVYTTEVKEKGKSAVAITYTTGVKSVRTQQHFMNIYADSFAKVAQAMVQADGDAAKKAFAAALSDMNTSAPDTREQIERLFDVMGWDKRMLRPVKT